MSVHTIGRLRRYNTKWYCYSYITTLTTQYVKYDFVVLVPVVLSNQLFNPRWLLAISRGYKYKNNINNLIYIVMDSITVIVPETWDDITVNQFEDLALLNARQYDDSNDRMYDMIKVFTGASNDTVDRLLDYSPEAVGPCLKFIKEAIPIKAITKVKISGTTYGYTKDLNSLLWGEVMSFEMMVANYRLKNSHITSLAVTMMLRKFNRDGTLSEFNGADMLQLWDMVKQQPITQVLYIGKQFLNWRSMMLKNYSGLFRTDDDDDDGPGRGAVVLDPKWNWYSMQSKLCNEDLTKFNDIDQLSYIQCMNHLSYLKEKGDIIKHMEQKERIKNKVKNNRKR